MIVGLAWYRSEDYPRILAIMKDAQALPETFKGWFRRAEKTERELGRQGILTTRIIVEPDAFLAYCAERNLEAVAGTRSRYASDQAAILTGGPTASEPNPFAKYLSPPR